MRFVWGSTLEERLKRFLYRIVEVPGWGALMRQSDMWDNHTEALPKERQTIGEPIAQKVNADSDQSIVCYRGNTLQSILHERVEMIDREVYVMNAGVYIEQGMITLRLSLFQGRARYEAGGRSERLEFYRRL